MTKGLSLTDDALDLHGTWLGGAYARPGTGDRGDRGWLGIHWATKFGSRRVLTTVGGANLHQTMATLGECLSTLSLRPRLSPFSNFIGLDAPQVVHTLVNNPSLGDTLTCSIPVLAFVWSLPA
jgi:hypothetical protein